MAAEQDVEKILALLKRAIRSSGLSQKDVDRQIGVQPGYLSQVMIGRLDLKVKHLLRALQAIQVDPNGFFSLAFTGSSAGAGRTEGAVDLPLAEPARRPVPLAATPAPEAEAGPSIPDEEFRRLVAKALAEELGLALGASQPIAQGK
jgi:transcriptional regulator with XRE-family HTH domain